MIFVQDEYTVTEGKNT